MSNWTPEKADKLMLIVCGTIALASSIALFIIW
jgi:hypothetical protein